MRLVFDKLMNRFRKRARGGCGSVTIPAKAKTVLRCLIIADTHGTLTVLEAPDDSVDVCFLLGDISDNDMRIIKDVVKVPIYGILGNHDPYERLEKVNVQNIHAKTIEVNGLKIAGFQGSCRYKSGNYPMYTDEESVEIARTMKPADVLLSHDGPKMNSESKPDAHSGLSGITEYLQMNNVPLNIHGHNHEDSYEKFGNAQVIGCFGIRILTIKTYEKENSSAF